MNRRTGHSKGSEPSKFTHSVQFHDSKEFLQEVVGEFLGEGLAKGEPGIVVANREHWQLFKAQLEAREFQVEELRGTGLLTVLDADEMLAAFMVGDSPSPALFDLILGAEVENRIRKSSGKRIRAYGEMVDVLWAAGKRSAAIKIEELWNSLGRRFSFSLLCTYARSNFFKEGRDNDCRKIQKAHTHVLGGHELYLSTARA